MLWTIPLLPLLAGLLLWSGQLVVPGWRAGASRAVLGAATALTCVATLGFAVAGLVRGGTATYDAGAGLELVAELPTVAGAVAILVAAVALVVTLYASVHEDERGLHRLVSLLLVFVGAMQLIVVAGDVLTLLVGWELVGALSWALIGHEWRDPDRPRRAAHAFNATRVGGLGLFLAAGAGFAGSGSLAFADWHTLTGWHLGAVVAGVLLAAVSKSAQVPFSPWLFSAMAGPTSVSALLHSSTMVAAGAYALIRLHPILDRADWFAPTTIAFGLVTALAGGVVAAIQHDAKKLLAASTSAQYGLMLVAVGAGYPLVAAVHLVVHALFKAQLFLATGIAQEAVGSLELGRMRLGRHLRTTAALAAVGAVSLAAVPPLAGGFSKEKIVTAGSHHAVAIGLGVIVAGFLTAVYATRYQLLAFGRDLREDPGPRPLVRRPGPVEVGALATLAVGLLLLSALWIPAVEHTVTRWFAGELPAGKPWELALSVATIAVGIYGTVLADRDGHLGVIGLRGRERAAAEWLGLPELVRRAVVDPSLRAATAAARFDDAVIDRLVSGIGRGGQRIAGRAGTADDAFVDGGVRGIAGLGVSLARLASGLGERAIDGAVELVGRTVDRASADARRPQTGLVHHQYVVIVSGVAIALVAALVGR